MISEIKKNENMGKIEGRIFEAFKSEREVYKKIMEIGFLKYVESLPDFKKAFDVDFDNSVSCIDEGIPQKAKLHMAGSGILLNEDLGQLLRQNEIRKIISHGGCGAANKAEKNAEEWTREVANSFDLEYEHISEEKMIRPKEGHIAGTCYCDFSGRFTNWSEVNGLPAGFIVSRKLLGKEIALKDIELAIEIAFGKHGLGDLLSEENKFLLVIVAGNQEQLEKNRQELETLLKDNPYKDKIRVEEFLAPIEE